MATASAGEGDPTQTQGTATGAPPGPAKKRPEDYRFGKLLGEGSFSSVYLAKDIKTGNECAIKVCMKQLIIRERKAELIKREKEVMTILSTNRDEKVPFFVKLHATFQDNERLYFVLTYARGGELLKYISRKKTTDHFFDLTCCRFYFGEIIAALAHLHSLSIVHRDLKPENILLDEKGHVRITDFGSAKILNAKGLGEDKQEQPSESTTDKEETESPQRRRIKRNNSFVGTAQYVSPEVLQGKYTTVGPASDLWAVGSILYQCTFGITPFSAGTEYLIFQKILKLEYEFPSDIDYYQPTRDLIEKLLKLEPSERLGAQDAQRYTSIESHPFFGSEDLHQFYARNPTPLFPYLTSSEEVGSGEAVHKNSYKVPDTIPPGFNPRLIAQRALQDDDGIPFGGNSAVHKLSTEPVQNDVVKNKPLESMEADLASQQQHRQISNDKKEDELKNNNTEPTLNNSSNNDQNCGCHCTLF